MMILRGCPLSLLSAPLQVRISIMKRHAVGTKNIVVPAPMDLVFARKALASPPPQAARAIHALRLHPSIQIAPLSAFTHAQVIQRAHNA